MIYFGAATSSYQVEGGINNSDWSTFKDAGLACDSWNKYQEDIKLLTSLNLNAYRFSLEWSRIEPKEGIFDEKTIKHYVEMIEELKKNNIEPFITLWHFTLPIWLADKNGVLNKKFNYYFLRYLKKIVPYLSKNVNYYVTINEPTVYLIKGFIEGTWPPQKKNLYLTIKAYLNLIQTHNNAYQLIHSLNPKAKVSIAHNINWHYGHDFASKLYVKIIHYFNDTFLLSQLKFDFIGLNYYMRYHLRNLQHFQKPGNNSDMGWEIYPEGLLFILRSLNKYHKPIYITENGIADEKDEKRADYISEHLKTIKQALMEKIDVKGYFYWSLLDNFEWADEYKYKFGLATKDRVLKPSALVYKGIIKNY